MPGVPERLLDAVRSGDPNGFDWACRVMGPALLADAVASETLRAELEGGSNRAAATRLLGAARRGEPPIRDALIRLMEDRDAEVRRKAIAGLSSQGGDLGVVEGLRARAADPAAAVRHAAIGVLAEHGHLDAAELLAWVGVRDDSGREAYAPRERVASALARHLRTRPSFRADLEARLEDPEWTVRQGAALALARALPDDDRLAARLLTGLDDDRDASYWDFRHACAQILLGSSDLAADRAAALTLAAELRYGLEPWQDELQRFNRGRAAEALGSADALPRYPEVERALRSALEDPDEHVRSSAWSALRRVLTSPTTLGRSADE